VTKYRSDLRRILSVVLRLEGRREGFEEAWGRLERALEERRQKIPEEQSRTSARKVKDATEEEAVALFRELKRHALKSGNLSAVLAALYCLVAGHSGFRPIELIGATLVGTTLTLRNAKRRPGQAAARPLNLSKLQPDVLTGLNLLISLVPSNMRHAEFRAWHKTLAQQMRRACERIEAKRILSPYSFRHVAIASWALAGLSPAEIAQLAGHVSIRTHQVHYARAKVGHKRKGVARAAPAMAQELPSRPEPQAAGSFAPSTAAPASPVGQLADPIFGYDMPEPVYKKAPGLPMDPEAVSAGLNRHVDPRSADEIARSLAAARLRRESKAAHGDPSAYEGPHAPSSDND
jgi:hypothetical protein